MKDIQEAINNLAHSASCGADWDDIKKWISAIKSEIKRAEYKKYEFCEDVKCPHLIWVTDHYKCYQQLCDCPHTAKELHQWLNEHGFKTTKESK